VFVTLSGGLDSTTVAVLARRWIDGVTAVTFCVDDALGRDDPSGDLASARRVADELGMPLEVVAVTPDDLISLVDPVLVHGQDWRDFNVHSGLVNAAIAAGLRQRFSLATGPQQRPVLITGDTMNELMADYAAENYAGRSFYSLPRLPAAQLRRFLVDGLDSGDREVGIFCHYGFETLQPYALCADAYAAIPGGQLESEHAKRTLVRAVMGDEIPAHVYDRPKVRAQVASAAGVAGTLAAMVDRGFDSRRLAQRFADLLGAAPNDLGNLIRAGFYRFDSQYPEDVPSPGKAWHRE
jgi:asparagine synthetase B (glutamine-hydrolysing)